MRDFERERAIELVCFDIGGVLMRVHESWERTLGLAGVEEPAAVMARVERATILPLMSAFELGTIEPEEFFERISALLALERDLVRQAMVLWLDRPYEGLEALLGQLRSAGVRTACLSNTNAFHWALMTGESAASLPLASLDHRFASHLLGLAKPDPRIYEAVERHAALSPGAIAFYDDRQVNVEGALARGWRSVRVDPAGDTIAAMTEDLRRAGALLVSS